jgi:hypothetical protein
MQTSSRHPAQDGAAVETEAEQLRSGDHAVLPLR